MIATDNKLWLPPFLPKDQELLDQRHKKQMRQKKAINKWRWGISDKTGWDWLQFLLQLLTAFALPIALFLAAQWFGTQQSQASELASKHQHQTDLQIAADQQRETTLQTYLDEMSDLLLNHNLRTSKSGNEVSQVARERTLTTLRRLDANRNKTLLQFLQDAQLIGVKNAVIDLSGADLSNDDLREVNLRESSLSGSSLRGVSLDLANLTGANLAGADLTKANLIGAFLSGANLSGANLIRANLKWIDLIGASLVLADLRRANLIGADLIGADLIGADLRGVDLRGANLKGADLRGADLRGANLKGANMKGANLRESEALKAQIQEIKSLDITMHTRSMLSP